MSSKQHSSTTSRKPAGNPVRRPATPVPETREEILVKTVGDMAHEAFTLYSMVNCALDCWMQADSHVAQSSQDMTDVEYLFNDVQARLQKLGNTLFDAGYVPNTPARVTQ